jgi:hypothetical protein
MTYRIHRHDNTRISIELDGILAFELERENAGRGFWGLYPVHSGARGVRITTDQYSNDLIEWITSGLVRGGHLASVAGGYVVPVPAGAGEFYVSGTGYLCCRTPVRMVLTEKPVTGQGIRWGTQIRPASLTEREAAGLDMTDSTIAGVFLSPVVE